MAEKDIKAPFPREPWKRLLEVAGDTPPETTDARIRASARQAVTPHAARWWVHAGLAASFVVAVVIAQALLGGGGKDPSGESRMEVDLVDRSKAISPPPPPEAAVAPLRKESASAPGQYPADQSAYEDEEPLAGEVSEIEVTGSRIGGPERERRAASETPEEDYAETPKSEVAADSPESAAAAAAAESDTAAEESARPRALGTSALPASWQKTPDEWYTRIVALRKAGRDAEADAELERFEAAWPDWMKQHGKPRP